LDDHEVVGTVDAEIIGIEQEAVGVMLVDDLEPVLLRHANALAKIDANEGHDLSPVFSDAISSRVSRRLSAYTCISISCIC
jgi:hypothetical protein